MGSAPLVPVGQATVRNQALYRSLLQESSAGGVDLMGKLVVAARLVLQTQEAATRDLRVRDALIDSASQLRQLQPQLCNNFPAALARAFAAPQADKQSSSPAGVALQFDQLELMDDVQVLTRVALARVQQTAMQAAEASLLDLNNLMCSVLGLSAVRADANPLRPESYVYALKQVLELTPASAATQLQWCNAMAVTLGRELRALYSGLCTRLHQEGVATLKYAMPARTGGGGVPPPLAVKEETLLTLDELRKLLAGELAPAAPGSRVEQFAAQFARQFEDRPDAGPATVFDSTVPAALEALTELRQVQRVVQGLAQRNAAPATQSAPHEDSIEGQRLVLRTCARDAAQALSLEVVTLMVDNMARDPRLLEPVCQVIRSLEPALLRLALVDPRFFSDKQHPARRLLQALTHRSLAFESTTASGFDRFLQEVQATLSPLLGAPIDNAEVFGQKLDVLQQGWSQARQANRKNHDTAVQVLQHAEARNLLAERIAQRIDSHPDSAKVPPVVIDFLCGPWAQVVAQAHIKQGAGSAAAQKFEALIPALLWSAHPELARSSPSKLTRVVPRLLATLREGLDTIHYPGTRTSAFMEALMGIHQQVFQASSAAATAQQVAPSTPPAPVLQRKRPVVDGDPWIAPEEAAASNFVELQEPVGRSPSVAALDPGSRADGDLPMGCWVEILGNAQWVRAQLTWASPHGTLYLFTGAFGATQSMTRRSRDMLLASGKLRLISGQPVVEGALDAVAQTAMRNSVHSTLQDKPQPGPGPHL